MPKQINGVEVTDNGDGTVNIQIGAFGYTRDKADLFDRSAPNTEVVRENLRLAFQIGGYAEPASAEFLAAVNNGTKGLQANDGKYTIKSIVLSNPDAREYDVEFTNKQGQTFGFTISRDDLAMEASSHETVIRNLVPFLRVGGHADLTASALAQIRAKAFWF